MNSFQVAAEIYNNQVNISPVILYNSVNSARMEDFFIENMIKEYQNVLQIVRVIGNINKLPIIIIYNIIIIFNRKCAMDAFKVALNAIFNL